jgi:hypothetical protein
LGDVITEARPTAKSTSLTQTQKRRLPQGKPPSL